MATVIPEGTKSITLERGTTYSYTATTTVNIINCGGDIKYQEDDWRHQLLTQSEAEDTTKQWMPVSRGSGFPTPLKEIFLKAKDISIDIRFEEIL